MMLTQERLKLLLSYDSETGEFTRLVTRPGRGAFVGSVAGYLDDVGYVRIGVDGITYKAHRLAWFYVNGKWPDGEIDHINCNRSDNRFENLRDATRAQNRTNCRAYKNCTSGIKGVSYAPRNRKWKAQIQKDGKKVGLGYFNSKEEAAAAYERAALEQFGEFARAA